MDKQEELLKNAMKKITPDIWGDIEKDLKAELMNAEQPVQAAAEEAAQPAKPEFSVLDGGKTEEVSVRVKKTGRLPGFRRWIAAAACLVILVGGIWGVNGYQLAHAVDSIISLDVNPSIEITMNSKERVIDVIAGNEDAKTVIGDMDFRGADIDVAINALLGSLLRNGYIDAAKNSILLTVDNKDAEKAEVLRQKLLDEISTILDQDGIEPAVLSQLNEEDESIEALAESYGISSGKARLIEDIVESNPRYTFEELAELTINELNLLAASPQVELAHISSTGKASDKGYIGEAKAKEIAFAAAGVDASEIRGLEVEMEYGGGTMVYEVEFETSKGEYEYDIDASTGDIVKQEVEIGGGDSDDDSDDEDEDDDDDDDEDDDDDDRR